MDRLEFLRSVLALGAMPAAIIALPLVKEEFESQIKMGSVGGMEIVDVELDYGPIKIVDGEATVTVSPIRIVLERTSDV